MTVVTGNGNASLQFDDRKKYQEQEEVYFDDGREIKLLHHIYNRPDIGELRNNPSRILAAIDDYARTQKYLMNVGEDKGKIVTEAIKDAKPRTMVELGAYVGYSTILFGKALQEAGGEQYFSLERNPEFAAVTASLIDLAGLRSFVKILVGPSAVSLKRLHQEQAIKQIDFMFLDHYKPAYTTDLMLCEELGLIRPGSVLAADNVIKPGNPPYLEYVRKTCEQKRQATKNKMQNGIDVRFEDKTSRQYQARQGIEKLDEDLVGNPNLIYESHLIHSFEPSGVPDAVDMTRCVGEEETG